ncbi:hypothetical protein CHS0354_013927 [Potamilus streckersoni]|uniref:NodB homology domain-containing protein n=1 Tax=Potamilus streckersoni TaxID=2493646 RepID=A0AAE0RWN7_9BIVA|nr:hypothetical protein CHS0354_013927 [Potamilus streckersoni]
MKTLFSLVVLVGLFKYSFQQSTCDPKTCVLPNCRCLNDPNIPGKLNVADTPQIILVTLENVINGEYVDIYTSFFELKNPNGCPTHGTFFVQDSGTTYSLVANLAKDGHEIGVFSLDGNLPNDWNKMIKSMLDKLSSSGIDTKSVKGLRAPGLNIGGDEEFIGLGLNGLQYDSSCASAELSRQETMVWPFTYNFVPGPACDIGSGPANPFPGKWEFLISDMNWNGVPCATPSACINVTTKQDAFDLLFNTFRDHYLGNRSPFTLVINPQWAKSDFSREGTIEFLQYVRAAFSDTYIVTMSQALAWIQQPTPLANLTNFAPWMCPKDEKLTYEPVY